MPVVVVSEEPVRKELKTAPPDGYVLIREMSYAERLTRSGLQGKMKVLNQRKTGNDAVGEVEMALAAITKWDFANLIVEHNLQDKTGQLLNLKTDAGLAKLPSKIGEEIGQYIDEINNFEEDVAEGN